MEDFSVLEAWLFLTIYTDLSVYICEAAQVIFLPVWAVGAVDASAQLNSPLVTSIFVWFSPPRDLMSLSCFFFAVSYFYDPLSHVHTRLVIK